MSLREHLQAIYDERGELTPALVVDLARDEKHPLHGRFEWDDTTAAEKFRVRQAHDLIKSVRITFSSPRTGDDISIRAFHAIRQPDGQKFAYQPTQIVVQDPIAAQLIIGQMQRDWMNLKRRWEAFQEFWDLVTDDVRIAVDVVD